MQTTTEKSYSVFYKEFFDTLNFTLAVKKLNKANPNDQSDYSFINAEQTFINVFDHYFQNQDSAKGLTKRSKKFPELVRKSNPNYKHVSDKEIREMYLIYHQIFKDQLFEKYVRAFFLLDIYPNNRNRFKFLAKWLKEKI